MRNELKRGHMRNKRADTQSSTAKLSLRIVFSQASLETARPAMLLIVCGE